MVTFCTNKNGIMNSVSDEEDLDIAHMSDFQATRLCIGVIDRSIKR